MKPLLVVCTALTLVLSVPAVADPVANTAASATAKVKRALKLGKSADKRSKKALKTANSALARSKPGPAGPAGPAGPRGLTGPPGPQGGQGAAGAPAASSIMGSTDSGIDLDPIEFAPSGYTDGGDAGHADSFQTSQVSPFVGTEVRDLAVELAAAPGAGTRIARVLVDPAGEKPEIIAISCSITGDDTNCDSGSDSGPVPRGSAVTLQFDTSGLARFSPGARWAFRMTTP